MKQVFRNNKRKSGSEERLPGSLTPVWNPGAPSHGSVSKFGGLSRKPFQSGVRGFTLVELLLALAIIITLSAVAVPFYNEHQEQAMITQAIGGVRALETEIDVFELQFDRLPNSLSEIDRADMVDPWGNAYVYTNFEDAKNQSQIRLDKNLKPINTTYDLYSMGEDGKSAPPLTAMPSRDDIVRANDGGFVGLATEF